MGSVAIMPHPFRPALECKGSTSPSPALDARNRIKGFRQQQHVAQPFSNRADAVADPALEGAEASGKIAVRPNCRLQFLEAARVHRRERQRLEYPQGAAFHADVMPAEDKTDIVELPLGRIGERRRAELCRLHHGHVRGLLFGKLSLGLLGPVLERQGNAHLGDRLGQLLQLVEIAHVRRVVDGVLQEHACHARLHALDFARGRAANVVWR